jgi:multisubunit Na+/H+ antiporter MnhB subunit
MDSSHFTAALVFALSTSIVFGVTSKNTDRERFRYGIQVFGIFMAVLLGGAWLMYLIRR